MKFKSHNDTSINTDGTSLAGTIMADYNDIVTLFGEPLREMSEKTQANWELHFDDGLVATIYDWKEMSEPEDVMAWNVGSFDKDKGAVMERMRSLFPTKAIYTTNIKFSI